MNKTFKKSFKSKLNFFEKFKKKNKIKTKKKKRLKIIYLDMEVLLIKIHVIIQKKKFRQVIPWF